jgi:hypothetical protein
MCRSVPPPPLTEIVSQNLLPPLLDALEAMLELTGTVLIDAYPAVADIHYAAREPSGASAVSTALFNQTWALEDTVRVLRHYLEEVASSPEPRPTEPFSSDFPF